MGGVRKVRNGHMQIHQVSSPEVRTGGVVVLEGSSVISRRTIPRLKLQVQPAGLARHHGKRIGCRAGTRPINGALQITDVEVPGIRRSAGNRPPRLLNIQGCRARIGYRKVSGTALVAVNIKVSIRHHEGCAGTGGHECPGRRSHFQRTDISVGCQIEGQRGALSRRRCRQGARVMVGLSQCDGNFQVAGFSGSYRVVTVI